MRSIAGFLMLILATNWATRGALGLGGGLLFPAGTAGNNQWSVSLVNAATITTKTKKIKDVAVGQVIQVGGSKFIKIGDNRFMAAERYPCTDPDLTYAGASKDFDYTGDEQTYTAYSGCKYQVEVWGAQGGKASNYEGGYGAYSTGIIYFLQPTPLYINAGGLGSNVTGSSGTAPGGYNGGGDTYSGGSWPGSINGSGGGATSIATVTGVLKNLSAYQNTGGTNISREIIIVAGGGGGTAYVRKEDYGFGGHGGGLTGGNGNELPSAYTYTTGGTQTQGGCLFYSSYSTCDAAFGRGMNLRRAGDGYHGGAGGGGWFGGGAGNYNYSPGGGGGSGYIGSSNLLTDTSYSVTKHMTCYNCATSTADATRTQSNTCVNATATADCSKTGNGFARITRLN